MCTAASCACAAPCLRSHIRLRLCLDTVMAWVLSHRLSQLLSSPELEATTSLVHNGLAFTAMAFVPSTAILVPEGACCTLGMHTC